MWRQLGPAFRIVLLFTVLTGLIYPGIVTALSEILFYRQANGSLLTVNGQAVGSALIAQDFSRPDYFHARPSAAGTNGYDGANSNGSQYGPTNQKLIDRVKASVDQFRKENPEYIGPVPPDAVTASASGLDPDISPANAEAQSTRVAKARNISVQDIRRLIAKNTKGRTLGLMGEPRVNVLMLNLDLDQQFPGK